MARLKIYNDTTDTWEYVSTPNGLASASDIDTGTDTSKSLTSAAVANSFIGGKDGWVKLPACSYYSATQISFAPGVYPTNGPLDGAKIKLTNASTVKYFIITSVATDGGGNTILSLSGMNGVTVANSAITLPYYSLMASPRGFGADRDIKGESIRIQKNATQSINGSTNYTLTFQTAISGYDTSLFELNSNGVKILSNKIKTVLVTLNSQIANNHVYVLYINNNAIQLAALGTPAADSHQLSGIVVAVSQNDIITGHIYDVTGATQVTSAGDWNFMTVTVLTTNQ